MTVSLPVPVQAVFDATNAGDTDAFLATAQATSPSVRTDSASPA